jgi:hypothetical protein
VVGKQVLLPPSRFNYFGGGRRFTIVILQSSPTYFPDLIAQSHDPFSVYRSIQIASANFRDGEHNASAYRLCSWSTGAWRLPAPSRSPARSSASAYRLCSWSTGAWRLRCAGDGGEEEKEVGIGGDAWVEGGVREEEEKGTGRGAAATGRRRRGRIPSPLRGVDGDANVDARSGWGLRGRGCDSGQRRGQAGR